MEKLPATLQFLGADKKREQDTVLRMMCVEILLLLSTSKSSPAPLVRDCANVIQHIQVDSRCGIEARTMSSVKRTKSRRINRCVCILTHVDTIEADRTQIKEAIERLVGLLEGEESRETREQQLEHLVRGSQAEGDDVGGEMAVLEV